MKVGWDELVMLLAKAFANADEKCTHRHVLILMVEEYYNSKGKLVRTRYWTTYLGDLNRIKEALKDIAVKAGLGDK